MVHHLPIWHSASASRLQRCHRWQAHHYQGWEFQPPTRAPCFRFCRSLPVVRTWCGWPPGLCHRPIGAGWRWLAPGNTAEQSFHPDLELALPPLGVQLLLESVLQSGAETRAHHYNLPGGRSKSIQWSFFWVTKLSKNQYFSSYSSPLIIIWCHFKPYTSYSKTRTIVCCQFDCARLLIPICYLPDFHIPWRSVVTLYVHTDRHWLGRIDERDHGNILN